MAYCEWQEVNCPFAGKIDQCRIEPKAKFLRFESKQAVRGSERYWAIEDQLSDLAQLRCSLEEVLPLSLRIDDLTDQQLALVGGSRKGKPLPLSPDRQAYFERRRQSQTGRLTERDHQIWELQKESDLSHEARAEILDISMATYYKKTKAIETVQSDSIISKIFIN